MVRGEGGRHSARGRLRWTKNSKPGGQLQNNFENPADVDHKQRLLHGFCKDHYRTPPQMKNTRAHAGSIYTSNAYTHNTQAKAISHMCIMLNYDDIMLNMMIFTERANRRGRVGCVGPLCAGAPNFER